jgi:hypothetical protein
MVSMGCAGPASSFDRIGSCPYRGGYGWRSQVATNDEQVDVGACHSLDLPFVWTTPDLADSQKFTDPNPPQGLAETLHQTWADFAKGQEVPWPAYDTDTRQIMSYAHNSDDTAHQGVQDPPRQRTEMVGREPRNHLTDKAEPAAPPHQLGRRGCRWAGLSSGNRSEHCRLPAHARRADAEQPLTVKIRTIPGPTNRSECGKSLFALVSNVWPVYHQQTKNLLVSYSPKKLGFF